MAQSPEDRPLTEMIRHDEPLSDPHDQELSGVQNLLFQVPYDPKTFAEASGPLTYLRHLIDVIITDVVGLYKAAKSYGPSWKQRGGVGAFMMLARKWDRLEQRVKRHNYDIFVAVKADTRREGLIDDVRDLRRYLLLVEAELVQEGIVRIERSTKDADK